MLYVIKDIRDNKIYLDNDGFQRNFETILEENITEKEAKKKYPTIIDVRK